MFRTIFQNIRVYVSSKWTEAVMGAMGMLLIWSISTVYTLQTTQVNDRIAINNNQMNEKISDIAKSSESTAQSMHELVIFVKEDRVKITSLENRVKTLEDWKIAHDKLTTDFFREYDLKKRK